MQLKHLTVARCLHCLSLAHRPRNGLRIQIEDTLQRRHLLAGGIGRCSQSTQFGGAASSEILGFPADYRVARRRNRYPL